jgi:hypothetical protein
MPPRQVRAVYDPDTITVYQAYGHEIADAAVAAGRFVPPFSMGRMTWIMPSFLWMMYRCGWASKPGQERVFAIRITRAGFETALSQACLSHFDPTRYADQATWKGALQTSPVRIQWDPERSVTGDPLPHRSLQIGLSGTAARRYVSEWIRDLEDITLAVLRRRQGLDELPAERPYPLPPPLAAHIGATPQ